MLAVMNQSIGVRLAVCIVMAGCVMALPAPRASVGNRLVYLDESDPFSVQGRFPKLTTPQWVGESGVEAVVILAIDDMREHQKYETFLRPIIDRLKRMDGRAPISIYSNTIRPEEPHLQAWLKEGLSLEVHTLAHPCPLLAKSNFVAAAETYHGCVDLLAQVQGNKPVAFRMPCCDSMNSPSPRFYSEIFNRTTPAGKFLTIDSSVMNIPTPRDVDLPREWVMEGGQERFRKYLPFPSFVTTVEDYPYPYVIGKVAWEFPAMVPSDWEAQNRHGVNNPATVADWKVGLDIAVRKQGTFTFIFHPHGWIRPEQLVEFIDYAATTYGRRVKFLNFREAQESLDRHLLAGNPLRNGVGADNGVRLMDLNHDGYLDVVIGRGKSVRPDKEAAVGGGDVLRSRIWDPKKLSWTETKFPTPLVSHDAGGRAIDLGVRFGISQKDGLPLAYVSREDEMGAGNALMIRGMWRFTGADWVEEKTMLSGLEINGRPVLTSRENKDRGVRFRDLDGEGGSELIVSNPEQQAVFGYSSVEQTWKRLSYSLPPGVVLVDDEGLDNGLRFVDLNEDGFDDVVFSNPTRFGVYLFTPRPVLNLRWEVGWSQKVRSGERGGGTNELPMIVRKAVPRDNGVWFHSGHMWVQNEDVAHLPDKVDRRSFRQLLAFDAPPPKSARESIGAMKVHPEFEVQLAAEEPAVRDPVAFEWGADGTLWVAEMIDYPVGIGTGKPGGAVRMLRDEDGDGVYERSVLFLGGVNFPAGIMPWRKGVIVSAAPEIFYAEDTDGDGKADLRRVLFTGFGEGNQQHRVNGFDYGLDNWVYGANGDSGGEIKSELTGQTVDIRGRDFRFQPDTGAFEAIAGQTQFGRHRDDWGNWFGNNNPNWLWHYYLPEHYLARNPYLAVRSTRRMLANYANSTQALAISQGTQRFNWPDMVNTVTSANSAMPYRDDLFGEAFATSVFISEPANNLIHREILEADGVSFRSQRAKEEEHSEFLASSDVWFRPTMIRTGPDGALYFADMYRLVIEHIGYALEGMEKQIDVRAGDDRGRIYRIVPRSRKLRPFRRLDQLDPVGLAKALDSANGWQRDTAQRLLVESRAVGARSELERLVREAESPKVRLQALCTLDGLGVLRQETIGAALSDRHFSIREHAVRLSEPILRQSGRAAGPSLELTRALLQLASDSNMRVRYQLAFSLGEWTDKRAGETLAALATAEGTEMHTAIISSAVPHVGTILGALLKNEVKATGLIEALVDLAASVGNEDALELALRALPDRPGGRLDDWMLSVGAGVISGAERKYQSFDRFFAQSKPSTKEGLERLPLVVAGARSLAVDNGEKEGVRLAGIRLLGRSSGSPVEEMDFKALAGILQPQNSQVLQRGALEVLGKSRSPQVARLLIGNWPAFSPAMRVEAVNVLLSRPEWAEALIGAVENEAIGAAQISVQHQQKLLAHSNSRVRERASRAFAQRQDRGTVLKEYDGVASLAVNQARGGELFQQHCATCHRLRGNGTALGPDLDSFSSKTSAELLGAVLDPNQSIETPYIAFTATTTSGSEMTGIIASESPNSITLRQAGGVEQVFLRKEIKSLASSGLSLMPEGFEKLLNPQDMADLIGFVFTKPQPKGGFKN